MLKLGGASTAATDSAKAWVCPTRAAGSIYEAATFRIQCVRCHRYRVPQRCGEFQGFFNDMRERMGINTRVIGSGTPWQHGIAERHRGILGTMWRKIVYEHDMRRTLMARVALSAMVNAKNSTNTRNNMTPEEAVFGRSLKFTEVVNRDDADILMGVRGRHGMAWKASQIRTVAKIMLLERDVTKRVRRAMLRKAPTIMGEVCPGARIYFWSASPTCGHRRQDSERWRGPATVIARESRGRYYLSWRGQAMLVAEEQVRHATSLEAAAADKVQRDVTTTAELEDKQYHDVSDEHAQPKIKGVKRMIFKIKGADGSGVLRSIRAATEYHFRGFPGVCVVSRD